MLRVEHVHKVKVQQEAHREDRQRPPERADTDEWREPRNGQVQVALVHARQEGEAQAHDGNGAEQGDGTLVDPSRERSPAPSGDRDRPQGEGS